MNIDINKISVLTGMVYSTPISLLDEGLMNFKNLTFSRKLKDSRWDIYLYFSEEPLNGEDFYNIEGPYNYPIFYRPGKGKILVLSHSKRIIQDFEERSLKKNRLKHIQNTLINIDDLVKLIVTKPESNYVLTFANAMYNLHGGALKYVTFYGEDLALASIFKENLLAMSFNRCGLKELSSDHEIMKLGNDGSIQIMFRKNDTHHYAEIDGVLRFINDHKYFQVVNR